VLTEVYPVHIVEGDAAVGHAIQTLLQTCGYVATLFPSAEAFLGAVGTDDPGCVLLDVRLAGLSGLELQTRLVSPGYSRPMVFLSDYTPVPDIVRAMRNGAVDFLIKPIQEHDLLPAIDRALVLEGTRRRELKAFRIARDRTAQLTPRERQVLSHVVRGFMNKQIAAALGTSERTVKLHRSRVLQKTGVRSVAQLMQLVTGSDADIRAAPIT
jgi:FixJ family two-component response regulator